MTDPQSSTGQTEQQATPAIPAAEPVAAISSAGPGQVFQKITHALTDGELTNPAVVKLIIDRMRTAETQREEYKQYVEKYHAADKKAGVLEEKLKTSVTNEILFGLSLTMGGAAFGFAQYFWALKDVTSGNLFNAIAAVLILAGIIARAFHGRTK